MKNFQEIDCLAYTGIPDCECSGTPQWSGDSGSIIKYWGTPKFIGTVKHWCKPAKRCPVKRGGKCLRYIKTEDKEPQKHNLDLGI